MNPHGHMCFEITSLAQCQSSSAKHFVMDIQDTPADIHEVCRSNLFVCVDSLTFM